MRLNNLQEGWSELPAINREKYQERDGLEGPIMTRSGKVVYYDPKAGSYYDPDTDMYISYDDWRMLDGEGMHMIDMEEGWMDTAKAVASKVGSAVKNFVTPGAVKKARQSNSTSSKGSIAKQINMPGFSEADNFNPNAGHMDSPMHPQNRGLTNPRNSSPRPKLRPKNFDQTVRRADINKAVKSAMSEARRKQLHDYQWPDADEYGDSNLHDAAFNAVRHEFPAYDAFDHLFSISADHRDWLLANKDELIDTFASYGLPMESVTESEDKPYVCVHAKKGKHECHAGSSYEAAKKAAAHWKLKSTAGIDAHLAVDETVNEGRMSDQLIHDSETMTKAEFAKKHGREAAEEYFESSNSAMDKALRRIEKTFSPERQEISNKITVLAQAVEMMTKPQWKDRALDHASQVGVNSVEEIKQELMLLLRDERELDDEDIDTSLNVKTIERTLEKLSSLNEVAGPDKCWPGYAPGAQSGVKTKAGTGKNKGKRVNNCEPIKKKK